MRFLTKICNSLLILASPEWYCIFLRFLFITFGNSVYIGLSSTSLETKPFEVTWVPIISTKKTMLGWQYLPISEYFIWRYFFVIIRKHRKHCMLLITTQAQKWRHSLEMRIVGIWAHCKPDLLVAFAVLTLISSKPIEVIDWVWVIDWDNFRKFWLSWK